MILPLDEIGQFPISLIIIAIIINAIFNHALYNSAVVFLFEKGLTNRQRREWRKERFFKRRTMRYMRQTIKSLPQQKFSNNIEKYHLMDVISGAVFVTVLVIVSVTYYIVREINWVILVAYAILEMLTVATSFFYFSHVTSYDKNGKFVGFFWGEYTFK